MGIQPALNISLAVDAENYTSAVLFWKIGYHII
jgi:hypothetical protein